MDAIGITNLRSLKDTGMIRLKPLNLLLGKNSSGKSTFLRTFPLLRQSYEVNTSGPLLWNGAYVDFGSFADARYRGADPQEPIRFSFEFDNFDHWMRRGVLRGPRKRRGQSGFGKVELQLHMVAQHNGATKLASMDLKFHDHQVKIEIDKQGVANCAVNGALKKQVDLFASRALIPLLRIQGAEEENFESILKGKGLAPNSIIKVRGELLTWEVDSSEAMLRTLPKLEVDADFKRMVKGWKLTHPDFRTLRDIAIFNNLPNIFRSLESQLESTAMHSIYSAPVRADAKRYYRLQDLAVNEVDFQGGNLAMFIGSLRPKDQEDFSSWMRTHFQFSPRVHHSEGHASIRLCEKDSLNEYNLADMGFGFSQVLPVLSQLWALTRKKGTRIYGNIPIIFAIEQPELHLHPGLQAQLADAFVDTIAIAQKKNIPLRLVIETHSETIINRIGHQIAAGNMRAEGVNVLLFEKDGPDAPTEVKQSGYDEEGFLVNWPLGFFLPKVV